MRGGKSTIITNIYKYDVNKVHILTKERVYTNASTHATKITSFITI
jgi:hypothetical protein